MEDATITVWDQGTIIPVHCGPCATGSQHTSLGWLEVYDGWPLFFHPSTVGRFRSFRPVASGLRATCQGGHKLYLGPDALLTAAGNGEPIAAPEALRARDRARRRRARLFRRPPAAARL